MSDSNSFFVALEREVLQKWDEQKTFDQAMEHSMGKKEFIFFDGPPFATGKPHYGHILAGTIKDIITRFKYQQGYHVPRVAGFDCHGLPIEFEIDKKLGITSSQDVYKYGLKKYNDECRGIVMRCVEDWVQTTARFGRWIKMEEKDCYKTLDTPYMESVWWIFAELYKKGLVYKGSRIMPYSTAVHTPVSNFEASQNYKMVQDPAITVRFKISTEDTNDKFYGYNLLVWTTTPWTLPSNLAICVNPDMVYVKVTHSESGDKFIVAQSRLEEVFVKDINMFDITDSFTGDMLEGTKYSHLFDCYSDHKNAFKVVCDNFVSDSAGTGIVHISPFFGEEDNRVCKENGIIDDSELECPIDENGKFTSRVKQYEGVYVKDADKLIVKNLRDIYAVFKESQVMHNYPFCWRSDTPLIYRTVPSWYIKVTAVKDKLIKNNKQVHWVPANIGENRFANWLENAKDWSVSRDRFWGTPLPVWTSEDGSEVVVISSIQELEEKAGLEPGTVTDLHRDIVDDITFVGDNGNTLRRIPQTMDCWMESGAMPYARMHYPFENKEKIEASFPADFIAEGLDQTRGWFYTLMVLSTCLFDKPAFKNVIVNGMVLASDGKKMSKRLKNYDPPEEVAEVTGADAIRLYLINSPVVTAGDLAFNTNEVKNLVRTIMIPWWNIYTFYIGLNKINYRNVSNGVNTKNLTVMDKWIVQLVNDFSESVNKEMDNYKLHNIVQPFFSVIKKLSKWWVNCNKNRLHDGDFTSYMVLTHVLRVICKTMAPITPFICEAMYEKLFPELKESSIHLLQNTKVGIVYTKDNESIIDGMGLFMDVINTGRTLRDRIVHNGSFSKTTIYVSKESDANFIYSFKDIIMRTFNSKGLCVSTKIKDFCKPVVTPNFKLVGQTFQKLAKKVQSNICNMTEEDIVLLLKGGEYTMEDPKCKLDLSYVNIQWLLRSDNQYGTVGDNGAFGLIFDLDKK